MPDDVLEMIGKEALLEQLAEESAELAQAALHMEPDKRPILRALEISATGAKLFNDIVCWIFAVQEGRELPHRDGWELAAALENRFACRRERLGDGRYDLQDAGAWFGGCAWENQALFEVDGTPAWTLSLPNILRGE